jgi:hypothetical protein
MPQQAFRRILEVIVDDTDHKKISGPVTDVDRLLKENVLRGLDDRHQGVYAIVVYDLKEDSLVKKYLLSTLLAEDSGNNLFVLFEAEPKPRPLPRMSEEMGIGQSVAASPLIDFLRDLFPQQHLQLPGVVFVRRLSLPSDPIYVPLGDRASSKKLVETFRSVFTRAVNAIKESEDSESYASALGRGLAIDGVTYLRATQKSVGERLLIAARTLWDHRKDLTAVLRGGVKIAKAAGFSG